MYEVWVADCGFVLHSVGESLAIAWSMMTTLRRVMVLHAWRKLKATIRVHLAGSSINVRMGLCGEW